MSQPVFHSPMPRWVDETQLRDRIAGELLAMADTLAAITVATPEQDNVRNILHTAYLTCALTIKKGPVT